MGSEFDYYVKGTIILLYAYVSQEVKLWNLILLKIEMVYSYCIVRL
jgi:hypothetical protein